MDILNQIFSTLYAGQMFHMRSAEQTRKLGLTGWSLWHEHESQVDVDYMVKLSELLTDKMKMDFSINTDELMTAYNYRPNGNLEAHHKYWYDREKSFCAKIKEAIKQLDYQDVDIYSLLLAKLGDVQNEMLHIDKINKELTNTAYNAMQVNTLSKELEVEYAKKEA